MNIAVHATGNMTHHKMSYLKKCKFVCVVTVKGRESILLQSSPSKSHIELLQARSQYLSLIQFGGQPSAQYGTDHAMYTCCWIM